MNSLVVALFVEDVAHEKLVGPLLSRIASEQNRQIDLKTLTATGGHGRVLSELNLYQQTILKGATSMHVPDLLVVAIDTNCYGLAERRRAIKKHLVAPFKALTVMALPDPHIERWYLADSVAFTKVVGVPAVPGRRKCQRDRYKRLLIEHIRKAEQPAPLGGIEFGPQLASEMDFYRVGKKEPSFKQFFSDTLSRLKLTLNQA